ncbi:hypothetical protein [Microbulbifer epialgicus]|uniref:Uncharacterized protein n=1 Tax=Microbulbifer epialgicus TaxID=393907 RepID=A0ABV4P783_9GAMM
MKKLTISKSLCRAVLKNSICGIVLICTSILAQAETITTKIDLGEPYPFRMEDGIKHEVNLDVGYQFDLIEKICINAEPKGGYASWAFLEVSSESEGPSTLPAPQMFLAEISFTLDLPTPENPNPVPRYENISFCSDQNSILAKNFLDGEGEFIFNVTGDYLDLLNFELVVEGDLTGIKLSIEIDEPADFSVPSYGGRVNYDASIRNLDSEQSLVTVKQWSVIKFPNGDEYPVHKLRDVVLNYSEPKDYTLNYLNIPAWFEAGDYELIWYVTDPSTGTRVKDSLYFTKSAD